MRIVTLEEHFTTREVLAATEHLRDRIPASGERIQTLLLDLGESADPSVNRLAQMDEGGVSQQVLSLAAAMLDRLPVETASSLVRHVNDRLAEVVRTHPSRFAGFATLNLLDPQEAVRELERATRELKMPGAIVNGTTAGQFLDHERFIPFWEAANHLRVPIYLHPAPPPDAVDQAYYSGLPGNLGQLLSVAGWGWHIETALHLLRLIASGLFDRFPNLRIIIGHMGEGLPFFLARTSQVLERMGNPHLKKSLREYLRQHVWITNSGFFTAEPFLCTKAVLGLDRMLFSVDYPFSQNTTGREFLNQLPLDEKEREDFAHGNADQLLGLHPGVKKNGQQQD